MDDRVRRFLGSAGSQAPQSPPPSAPPIIGTPADPPVPNSVTFTPRPSGTAGENSPSSTQPALPASTHAALPILWRYGPPMPARFVCRGTAPARGTAHRFPPTTDPAGYPGQSRAVRLTAETSGSPKS